MVPLLVIGDLEGWGKEAPFVPFRPSTLAGRWAGGSEGLQGSCSSLTPCVLGLKLIHFSSLHLPSLGCLGWDILK